MINGIVHKRARTNFIFKFPEGVEILGIATLNSKEEIVATNLGVYCINFVDKIIRKE